MHTHGTEVQVAIAAEEGKGWREEGLQRRGRQGKGSNFSKRSSHICGRMRNRIKDIRVPFLTPEAPRIELAPSNVPEITWRVQGYLGPKVVGGGSTAIQL